MSKRISVILIIGLLTGAAWGAPGAVDLGQSKAAAEQAIEDIHMSLGVVFETAQKTGGESARSAAASLADLEKEVVLAADPSGLKPAVLRFSDTVDGVFSLVHMLDASELPGVTERLRAVEAKLEALAGPQGKEKLELRRQERSALRALRLVRTALDEYRKDHGGWAPVDPVQALVPKYLPKLPALELPGHKASAQVRLVSDPAEVGDTGAWLYVTDSESEAFGRLSIDCKHQDSKGRAWSSY